MKKRIFTDKPNKSSNSPIIYIIITPQPRRIDDAFILRFKFSPSLIRTIDRVNPISVLGAKIAPPRRKGFLSPFSSPLKVYNPLLYACLNIHGRKTSADNAEATNATRRYTKLNIAIRFRITVLYN
jgi:hypothetical protein